MPSLPLYSGWAAGDPDAPREILEASGRDVAVRLVGVLLDAYEVAYLRRELEAAALWERVFREGGATIRFGWTEEEEDGDGE